MMKASRRKEKEVKDFMVFAKSYLNHEQGEVPK
jgi:hypothetical protein